MKYRIDPDWWEHKVSELEKHIREDDDMPPFMVHYVDGEEITFSERSGITREALEDGYYVMTARISDQRGDTYYSPVVGATVKGGKVVKWKTDPNFYGKSY